MSDLLFQNLMPVQSDKQPLPPTVASATDFAPTHFLTFITGTAQIENITPPVTGAHMLILIFTNAIPGTLLTTGNIANAVVPTQNLPTILVYDPVTAKYYGCAGNLT